jgi:preprotein translocase subunit SecG
MIMISLWRRRAPEIAKLVSVFTLCLSAIFLINTILLVLLNVGV